MKTRNIFAAAMVALLAVGPATAQEVMAPPPSIGPAPAQNQFGPGPGVGVPGDIYAPQPGIVTGGYPESIVYGDGDCDDGGCGNRGWIAGASLYFLQPRWQSNPAFYVGAAPGTGGTQVTQEFDWELEAAPGISLGYVGASGSGVRASYFYFDHSESLSSAAAPTAASPVPFGLNLGGAVGPGGFIQADSNLEMHVADFELLGQRQMGNWEIECSGGVRYAQIDQDYRVTGGPIIGGNAAPSATLTSNREFEGAGPTLALKTRRPLGDVFGGFAKARGALLYGSYDQTTSTSNPGAGMAPQGAATRIQNAEGLTSVFELELGVDFTLLLGNSELFIEAAWVNQIWNGIGNAAGGETFNGDNKQDLGLLGGRISAGIDF